MKGIPIKFRGKAENGEYVYGDLMQGNYDESAPRIKPRKKRPVYVDKNSVVQLVGYDKNGAEVYEGDTIINEYDYAVEFEKAIAKAGTRRACLAFETYIDWFDKPIGNFLTTEQQLKKRADYIKGFLKGGNDEQET